MNDQTAPPLYAGDPVLVDDLSLALTLAGRGWYVFPCREKPGQPYKDKRGNLVTPEVKSPYWHGDDLRNGKDNVDHRPGPNPTLVGALA